ncbi:MAG TPA: Uma2 family endonuclease [Kofleriaceae bacterium]|nr:Uma2 family endonuclease [Kofleriaceae bacterium]
MTGAGVSFSIEPERVRSLKRSEYDRLVELGLFQDERVELIRGVLVKTSPQLAPHASTVQRLTQLLATRLAGHFMLRIQSPLALSDDSEPEPDAAVVPVGDYDAEHPTTALLVIEVADSSLRTDRAKAAVYAGAGIGEYWIVNLTARTVELYTSPDGDRYAEARTLRTGDVLRPAALPDVAIAVAELLPRIT